MAIKCINCKNSFANNIEFDKHIKWCNLMPKKENKKCPHLNCLVNHGDNPCNCDMSRYCPECKKEDGNKRYMIIKIFRERGKNAEIVKSNMTLEEAREYCGRPNSRIDGEWFCGYDIM